MTLIKGKQIDRMISGQVILTGIAVAALANSVSITTGLTSAALVAGEGGTAVTNAAAGVSTPGWVVSASVDVQVWDSATKERLSDANGNEVYARHAVLGTLDFFSRINGAETAYVVPSATTIDIAVLYKFRFGELPHDALVGARVVYASDDPDAGTPIAAALTVSGVNTLSALALAPKAGTEVKITVNGQVLSSLSASPAFTVAGTAITWSATNAGYSLATTDVVVANYFV